MCCHPTYINNDHLISNLTHPNKIFETQSQLKQYLGNNNILFETQSGLRAEYSTITATDVWLCLMPSNDLIINTVLAVDNCLKAQRYLQLWCGSSVVHKLSYRQNSYSASLQKTSVFMQMTQSCICQKDLIRAFSSCDIEWHFQNMCPICWGNYLWSLPWIEKHCFDPVFSGRGNSSGNFCKYVRLQGRNSSTLWCLGTAFTLYTNSMFGTHHSLLHCLVPYLSLTLRTYHPFTRKVYTFPRVQSELGTSAFSYATPWSLKNNQDFLKLPGPIPWVK